MIGRDGKYKRTQLSQHLQALKLPLLTHTLRLHLIFSMASSQMIGFGLCLMLWAMAVSAGRELHDRPTLQWGSCPDTAAYLNSTAQIECSTIRLPMDYTEPNSTLLWDAPLVRVKALKQPSRGSIFVNWGGPGLPAIPNTVSRGQELLESVPCTLVRIRLEEKAS